MCGIAGFLESRGGDTAALTERVRKMADRLVHRGPDDAGAWVDGAAGAALGFRRLAIIDLTPAGAQPMASADGRFTIAFNGEIYNFRALRQQLESEGAGGWRGHSDTEVMLAGFVRWGWAETLEKLNGMFAIVLWDRRERTLRLARDRMGEKPLYYGWHGGTFLFGSELKALAAHPAWHGRIARGALDAYLRHDYVPGPGTIFADTFKLPPGHSLTVTAGAPGTRATPEPYWDAAAVAASALDNPFAGSDDEAVAEAERRIQDAVALRLESDVPLGVFLSGGIDSSLVTACMQRASSRPVRSFAIGLHDKERDEAPYAAAVARHLGTDHTELYVGDEDARALVPALPVAFDEPFGDFSQLPTMLLARLTRRHVTVALSGDGGDELFGGYPRYLRAADEWRRVTALPTPLRALVRGAASLWPRTALNALAARLGDRGRHALALWGARDFAEIALRQVTRWPGVPGLVVGAGAGGAALAVPAAGSPLQRAMLFDAATYLPDDLLVKIDRAAMAASLETRAPLLDHGLVAFAWSLPDRLKFRDGETKWLLKRVLYRAVPPALVDRPKRGFDVPLAQWLRGALRDWTEDLLDPARLTAEGFLDPGPIGRRWAECKAGGKDHRHELWNVLMFQAWLAQGRANGAVAAA